MTTLLARSRSRIAALALRRFTPRSRAGLAHPIARSSSREDRARSWTSPTGLWATAVTPRGGAAVSRRLRKGAARRRAGAAAQSRGSPFGSIAAARPRHLLESALSLRFAYDRVAFNGDTVALGATPARSSPSGSGFPSRRADANSRWSAGASAAMNFSTHQRRHVRSRHHTGGGAPSRAA